MPDSPQAYLPQTGDAYTAIAGQYKGITVLVGECDGADVVYVNATTGEEYPMMSLEKFRRYYRYIDED